MTNYQFKTLNETMQEAKLPNGLHIFYIPKQGFSKTFAMFSTNFGSVDSCFTMDGKKITTPDGVAHFLEHKMFEDVDGNALQKFAETGASPNAFTSHAMTAYHFECIDEFYKNLEILLKFVSTPYFTDENVEKEKGIIGQEIGMMDDTPNWQAYLNMFQGLYARHTIRDSIAGSVESISGIDKELLFLCHKAFYSPSNMVLVVCGEAEFDKICAMAEEILPKTGTEIASRDYGSEDENAFERERVLKMQVSMPIFMLGFKDKPVLQSESKLRREILGELACQCLCGPSTSLYVKLYNERLINRSFEIGYSMYPEGACLMLGGESRDPRAVRKLVQEELIRISNEGISEDLFERILKAAYGMRIRQLDEPDEIARAQTQAYFGGENFMTFPELFDSIKAGDIKEFLAPFADENKSSMAIVEPKEA